ncbi:MAG: molybdopterin-guanine dinucleotide biosynthesis protein B [bacterium]|nr:molybdopterin-guanine dinucleotide biosynthesis protein B [bacterium]MDT8396594.1 molybdopterin-guanine dinucleotide biosynthesis protein B [bacterium]
MTFDTPPRDIQPPDVPPLIVPVVAFIAARSGTGKTTLMESVLKELTARGYRVGTVKHSAHRVRIDKEGSDSWRFSRAGAVNSVVVGDNKMAVMRPAPENAAGQAIRDAARNADIVLVEGFKEIDLPKIEVYRKDHSTELLAGRGAAESFGIIAVATDGDLHVDDVPVLPLNEPRVVCDFIVERFFKGG